VVEGAEEEGVVKGDLGGGNLADNRDQLALELLQEHTP